MKDYKMEHEILRRQVWMNAWTAVANATNSYKPETATKWANSAVKDFDAAFPVSELAKINDTPDRHA